MCGDQKSDCNLAYSALACFRVGMSGPASFQRVGRVEAGSPKLDVWS
jgi:hypothetical protein